MRVMKFGGTSVRDAERIGIVTELVAAACLESKICVVVSALGGITDELGNAASDCSRGDRVFPERCNAMAERHLQIAAALTSGDARATLEQVIRSRFAELEIVLEGICLVRECSPRTLDKVLSMGELLSAALVAGALSESGIETEACDARQFIIADRRFGAARVNFETTYDRIVEHFSQTLPLQVVTGFLAQTEQGETATLGYGGSDYTASLVGAALYAERIEIWTDVDGVLSCDPHKVPEAFSQEALSYDELLELSHFGAKVVYSPAVHPARSRSVPLLIKNTLNPSFPGTRIEESAQPGENPIRGISAMSHIALIRLEGDGMATIAGAARRLFTALADGQVNTLLITQASSEHSICLAVEPGMATLARDVIHNEFEREREIGLIKDVVVDEDLSIVAVVGAGMNHRPGISGTLFEALGREEINVRAIAQGSSELNISFAVAAADEARVLQTLHLAFFAKPRTHLFLAGVGGVGSELLDQLRRTRPPAGWSLSGLLNSRRMSLDLGREDNAAWTLDRIAAGTGEATDLSRCLDFITSAPGHRILIDCTASDTLGSIYPLLLAAGVDIVAANKKPFAGAQESWRQITAAAASGGNLFFEATVGAGLPVIRTVQDQLATGDQLHKVEGLFSGTLGTLMTGLRTGHKFSDVVREAHSLGYTEPDPREDLNGMDVARKLLILVRLTGAELDLADLEIESLLDEEWSDMTTEDFWSHLPELDEPFARQVASAVSEGKVLTYLARWENGSGRVGLAALEPSHPCAQVEGTDNLFAFTTDRYADQPLVVSGPGAGRALTAAGVYSDLLRAVAEGRE